MKDGQKQKAAAIPWKKKSTGTCKEILHEGVQMTVSNKEQIAGQWVDRNKALLDSEDDNTFRSREILLYIDRCLIVIYIMFLFSGGRRPWELFIIKQNLISPTPRTSDSSG